MIKIIFFTLIAGSFGILRIISINKIKKACSNAVYKSSIKAYLWQIIGASSFLILLLFIIYFDINVGINAYIPDMLFVFMVAILAGICVFCVFVYGFTPIGIYDNGILTHFMFTAFDDIVCYRITDENMLNMGKGIRTVTFKLKNSNHIHPNFEYPIDEEEKIKAILNNLNIKEYALKKSVD